MGLRRSSFSLSEQHLLHDDVQKPTWNIKAFDDLLICQVLLYLWRGECLLSHRFFVGACCDVDARAELAIDLNPDAQRFVGGKLGIKGGPALLMNAELAAKLLPQLLDHEWCDRGQQ